MATPVHVIRLSRDYKHIQRSPIPYIETHPRQDNILIWPYIITGPPETPYSGGQYYGTVKFPENFPFAAPSIQMHTPSGRFHSNINICTTFTSLHPEEWNPAWTVETILLGFLSFMTSEDFGGGVLSGGSASMRENRAKVSAKWNSLHCAAFINDFPEVHASNIANENFTEAELTLLKVNEERSNRWMGDAVEQAEHDQAETGIMDSPFEPSNYEAHINEDWERFGSMEEDGDFDFYDGDSEQNEECESSETEIDEGE